MRGRRRLERMTWRGCDDGHVSLDSVGKVVVVWGQVVTVVGYGQSSSSLEDWGNDWITSRTRGGRRRWRESRTAGGDESKDA